LGHEFPYFQKQKVHGLWQYIHINGPYGKHLTKEEPIKMLGFTSRLPYHTVKFDYRNNKKQKDNPVL